MSIPFGCTCGKQLLAKDEFAGKKLRCPGCGKILTIPSPPYRTSEVSPTAPPAKPPVRSAPAPIQRAASVPEPAPPPPPRAPEPPPPPVVPSSSEDSPVTPLAPPRPALVNFPCVCGRQLKARQEDAG